MTNNINVIDMRPMYKFERRGGGRGVQKSYNRNMPNILVIAELRNILSKNNTGIRYGLNLRERFVDPTPSIIIKYL